MSPIGSCLENGINLLIFKAHGGQGCAEMLEELGISILQLRHSDLGGWAVPAWPKANGFW